MTDRKDASAVVYNLRKAQRTDPLTRVAARYPHEHATPADYAKAGEGPDPLDAATRRDTVLYRVLVALCAVPVLYLGGRIIIALIRATAP